MIYFNYDFESKIKFYFSLIFTSIKDYEALVENFGEDINIFNNEVRKIELNSELNPNLINNIIWNNKRINLSDKTILRLFDKEEVETYYNTYSSLNVNFNIDDSEDLENFYIYMLLQKVKEKKQIEYGTIYDLFDTFLDEEVINAVANLDFEDKKTFINLFGVKGDLPFEINSNDHVKNDILIKLYSYMLLKREEADIPSIIRNIIDKDAHEYDFYDYVRSLCGDKYLTNEFIFEMFKKMDYNSMKYIKDVFGSNLDKKKKPSREKDFKRAIQNLIVIVKINKEYRKKKETEFNHSNKRKAGFEETKKDNKEKKTNQEQKKEEPKQNFKKTEFKKEKNEQVKKDTKPKEKKEKKQELKKKENKKLRLSNFLLENGISKEDFLIAITLLDSVSKKVVELYYGLKKEPIDLEAIAQKLSKELEEIIEILENAEEKIVRLIKIGEIEKIKEENKKKGEAKASNSSNKLKSLLSSGKINMATIMTAMVILEPIEKLVVNHVLNSKESSFKEIALELNVKEEKAKDIFEVASNKIISSLKIDSKENNEEVKEEAKKEEGLKEKTKKEPEDKKENEKDSKGSSLASFLKETGLSKKEFFEGFKKLDDFSKKVMSLYLGLYSASVSVSEIAKIYGLNENEIKKVISSSKSIIVKSSAKEEKINLNAFLKENKLTNADFIKCLDSLSSSNRNLLKQYFGIGSLPVSLNVLAKRYNTDEATINKMVKGALNEVLSNSKKDNEDKDISNKLNRFLTVNNIDKTKFFIALELLSPEDKNLVSMYLGLNGREMSIAEIALLYKANPIVVKNNLSSILLNINSLAKSKDLNKMVVNKRYQSLRNKINTSYNMLINDINFVSVISTNPNILNTISVINKLGYDLETASSVLNISPNELINNMVSISMICDEYLNNMTKNKTSGFKDEEKENNKTK